MRRAAWLGAAGAPGASAVADITAPSALKRVGPEDFFPHSNRPEAVRERLANFLLGKTRVIDPNFDDYYRAVAASLTPKDNFLMVTSAEQEINAFAHYGGLIVLMRGMWEFAENEDALLGIVAHEMGHVKLDHFQRKKNLDDKISSISIPLLIAGLLAGSSELREGIIVGGSGIITGQIYGHSRELEHEADVVGLQILSGTGRDGRQMARLLGNLSGAPNEYVSTHPAPDRRAAYIKDRLISLPRFAPGDSEDFLMLFQKLSVLDKVSPDLIRGKRAELLSAFGARRAALQFGLFWAAEKSGDKPLAAEMEQALAGSEHPFAAAARGEYLSRHGEHKQAAELLASMRAANPMSASLAAGEIAALQRAGENMRALRLREELPEELGMRADILRHASRAAKALGKHVDANMLLAESHIQVGAFERARRQLEIAEQYGMSTKMLVRANKMQNIIRSELAALAEKQS